MHSERMADYYSSYHGFIGRRHALMVECRADLKSLFPIFYFFANFLRNSDVALLHITQLMTNIIWDVILVKYHAIQMFCNILYAMSAISHRAVLCRFELRISFFTCGSVPNLFNCTCQPLLLYFVKLQFLALRGT
ncbi:hypothetical protein T07_11239 [Trichinella nelsoni]|uniref:Uncharacterized protein n=1 Tax=Trichinella nelsoni TaxID=6336 RepID=A0A0V0SMQ8_9BILA|nr:hypothetical protein T07_11239 [Trichinella nelsoni]